jgi:cell division protein FtsL
MFKRRTNTLYKKYIHFRFCTNNNPIEPKGLMGKIKKFGKFGIIFYSAYVTIAYITFFLLLQYKVIDTNKTITWLEKKGVNKYIDVRKKIEQANPKLVNFIFAYILNQLFEVIRLPTTLLFLTYWMKRAKK